MRQKSGIVSSSASGGVAEWVTEADVDLTAETPVDLTAESSPYTLDAGCDFLLGNSYASMDTLELNGTDGLLGDDSVTTRISTVRVDVPSWVSIGNGPAYDRLRDLIWLQFYFEVTVQSAFGCTLQFANFPFSGYNLGVHYGNPAGTQDRVRGLTSDPDSGTDSSIHTQTMVPLIHSVTLPPIGTMLEARYQLQTDPERTEPEQITNGPWTNGPVLMGRNAPGSPVRTSDNTSMGWNVQSSGQVTANVTRIVLKRWRVS